MIIKTKDNSQDQIDYLSDLLERDFSDDKKSLIEREIKNLYSGKKGEETSAYYLDFDLGKSKNWMAIHDLRLEHEGNVAQIDHLLIGRMMDIYVIESKNFTSGVSISDEGDFSYFYKNRPYGIPSPIAQNERHIRLLDRLLSDSDLLPKRLGLKLKPSFKNIVLVSPSGRLSKPKKGTYDCSMVMKSDKFFERFSNDVKDDSLASMMNLTKIISQASLKLFAEKLVLLHKPITINYVDKFGLKMNSSVDKDVIEIAETPKCPKCNKAMIKRSAKKGKTVGAEFWGCCDFPRCRGVVSIKQEKEKEHPDESSPLCPKCYSVMLERVSKKGENSGKVFWGCSEFPKCFGTIPFDKKPS